MVLYALSSVPDALMQRAFQFKRQMIIMPTASFVLAGVSIICAVGGYGAWSMVIGWYAAVTTTVVLSWWMAKWRPFRGRASIRIWRDMAGFSLPILVDSIADRSREVIEQAIVGRALGTGDLGQFKYGYRIASLPSLAVTTICSHVLFPAFSRMSDDYGRFQQAYLRALGWIWFAAVPAGALMVVIGEPVVVLMLGEQWQAAGHAASAMAGIGLGAALNSVAGEAIKGAGRPALLNWSPALCLGLGVPLILLLVQFGLVGVGVAISVTAVGVGMVNVELARGVVGATRREVCARLVPTSLAAILALCVLWPLEHVVVQASSHTTFVGLAFVVAECLLFALVYLAVLRLISAHYYFALRSFCARALARMTSKGST
jgi:PST family polysaccharide transporter